MIDIRARLLGIFGAGIFRQATRCGWWTKMSKEDQIALIKTYIDHVISGPQQHDTAPPGAPPITITISSVGTLNILCRQEPPPPADPT